MLNTLAHEKGRAILDTSYGETQVRVYLSARFTVRALLLWASAFDATGLGGPMIDFRCEAVVSVAELSELLGVEKFTIYGWIRKGLQRLCPICR